MIRLSNSAVLLSYLCVIAQCYILPEKLVIGYGSNVDNVQKAIKNGVNVVIWSFAEILPHGDGTTVKTNLDLNGIKALKDESNDDVVHLISFGGWNAPHLHPDLSAKKWYHGFRQYLGFFDGFDWDFEGNDDMQKETNTFSIDCLNKMVEISRLAKDDGYCVAMAPPQSYLDFGHSSFSRRVNLTDTAREWHSEFSYFGKNVYAYILARDPEAIAFVSVQFYESYSRAAEHVYHFGKSPAQYLVEYVQQIVDNNEEYFVDFEEDSELRLPSQKVKLPLEKLVLGFGNGWASADKNFVATREDLTKTWNVLCSKKIMPKGLMYWTIEEDNDEVDFATTLKDVISIECKDSCASNTNYQ